MGERAFPNPIDPNLRLPRPAAVPVALAVFARHAAPCSSEAARMRDDSARALRD
jgi:hypothetical protein